MLQSPRDEYPRCICGAEVAVPHQECMALLTPRQRENFNKGVPVGPA